MRRLRVSRYYFRIKPHLDTGSSIKELLVNTDHDLVISTLHL